MPPFRATWSVQVEAKGSRLFAAPYALFSGEMNAQQTRLNPDEALFFASAFDGAGYAPMAYALLNLGAGVSIGVARARSISTLRSETCSMRRIRRR
jgi:hypothetical protein